MELYIDSNISVASEWHIEYTSDNNTNYLNTSIRNTTLHLESGKKYEIKIWSISLTVKSDTFLLIIVNTGKYILLQFYSLTSFSHLTVNMLMSDLCIFNKSYQP